MSITWNGINSDTIGVIVEKIPNRYIPTRRFSPQQVAGRNGNILLVDKAFPNVEQEYEVYLSAESQGLPSVARACAEWLMGPDGYCRLTDSYDTTVYREAFLMGGYDLENILNKFGRCTITFSCKPQKYLLTGDTPIEIPDGTTTTYTGDVVQFDVITGASITSLSTTISPLQDLHGYANPWPGGSGKNKCDYLNSDNLFIATSATARVKTSNIGTISISGNDVTLTRTADAAGLCVVFRGLAANTEYCFSEVYNNKVLLYYYGKITWIDDTSYTSERIGSNRHTFTTTDAGDYEVLIWISGKGAIDIQDAQLELGTTPTTFAPYSNICPITGLTGLSVYVSPTQDQQDATTYAIDWTTEAGTVYGGTLDVVTGVLTVDKAYADLGTASWTKRNTSTGHWRFTTQDFPCVIADSSSTVFDCVCSQYVKLSTADTYVGNTGVSNNTSISQVCVCDERYSDKDTFTNAMSGVQLVYPLATPLTYQLTGQEVEALVGTNNVWSSSGDVSVTVATLLGGIVTNQTPFEARPLLTVSGVGEIAINGKSIQILEFVSDFEIDCETMEAEDNSKIYCMEFPELSGGENKIVGYGSITALTVTPRWWTL